MGKQQPGRDRSDDARRMHEEQQRLQRNQRGGKPRRPDHEQDITQPGPQDAPNRDPTHGQQPSP
jgi:hypothetical protein